MNRLQLRTMLRRRIQETAAAQWSDDTLNTYLVLGLQFMERKILGLDPMAFIYTDTQNLVADEPDYPMPVNSMYEVGVYRKATTTAEYGWLNHAELPHLQMSTGDNADHVNPYSSCYSRKGRYITIYPTPSAALSAGLKLEYVPWLSMGADTDVPDIDIGLHEGIVYRAEMVTLGDTAQESVKAKEDLEAVIGDLANYYRRRGAPHKLSPLLPEQDYAS